MSLYKCEKCGIETSTSECPKCHSRTTPLMHIYWSKSKKCTCHRFSFNRK